MNFAYSAAVKRPTSEGASDYSSCSKFTRRAVEDSPESPPASSSLSMETHPGSQEGFDYRPPRTISGSPEQPLDFTKRMQEMQEDRVPMGQLGRTAKEPDARKVHEHFQWDSYKDAEEIGTARIKTAFHYGLREKFFYIARRNLENRRPTVVRFSFMEAFKLKKLLELVLRQSGELESRYDVIPLLADDWDLATEKYDKQDEQYFWRVNHLDTGTFRVRITFSKIHHDYVIFMNNVPTPNLAAVFPKWVGAVVTFTSLNLIRRLRDYLHYHLMVEEQ